MIRSLVKNTFASATSWMPLRSPFVVFYHRVVERLGEAGSPALPAMEISTAMLERHLDWLARRFEIVPIDEIATPRKRHTAAVTFDDGYSDVFHHAFPLLKRKGIPAAIFVITDLIGTPQPPIHERLYATVTRSGHADPFARTQYLLRNLPNAAVQRLVDEEQDAEREDLRPLTWQMLETMRDAGMTIGSHTKTHPFLVNESHAVMAAETAGSREVLRKRLGVEASCFAYPGGSFNDDVVDAVAAAGYRLAFTTCTHRDARHPHLTIPRTGLWQQSCLDLAGGFSSSIMRAQSTGALRWADRCPHGTSA